ncbi:hypothetical protein [Tessaracoccus oleiagri]|uniref:Uncharacterized protein n=1 Tax=Tessaracoccus oleiagri TaxID=686624 RepID=A0A1G9HEK1_9ACTN|nr:hypothetical protein [Tessaracoccus oleiagri]SDL11319.1 hypothetical protein SAMN04488242_0254 [Tessaracoccus oleiagri]
MGFPRSVATIAAVALFAAGAVTAPASAAPSLCRVNLQPAAPVVFEVDETDVVVTLERCGSGRLRIESEGPDGLGIMLIGSTPDGTYEFWSGIESAGEYRVRAVVDDVVSGWVPLAILKEPTVYSAGWKLIGEATNTWGRFDGSHATNEPVWTEFLVDGRWSKSQESTTSGTGSYVLPLTYGANTPGEYVFRVGARYYNGAVVYTEASSIERVARPAASHAGVKIVGETANVWGHFDVRWPAPVWTEVWTGAGFSKSQQGLTGSSGNYVLPLTYGASKPDFYWYRVAGDIGDGDIARTEPFFFRRVSRPTINAVPTAKVGQPVYASGGFDVSADYKAIKVWTEVWTGQRWSKSQERVSSSTGQYTIPLTYGATTAGTTRWRVVGQYAEGRVVSPEIRLTRVR